MHSNQFTALLGLLLCGCSAAAGAYRERVSQWDHLQDEGFEHAQDSADTLTDDAGLSELLSYARSHNPGLKAVFERWRVALERVPQANALANPRLNFATYLSEVETRVGPIDGVIGLSQAFPWFGKLRLKGEAAFEASEAARELMEQARLELDQSLRDAWYEYAWIEQAIGITRSNRELLAHWESVARTRNASGLGTHRDVIRSQVELGKLEDRVQTLMDLRRPLIARLNSALNRPMSENLPVPAIPLPAPKAIDEEALKSSLASTNPMLRAMDHGILAADLGVELADKAFYPDFSLGVDYTLIGSAVVPSLSGSGDDAIAVKLGIDLPIWRGKYRAGARASQANARAERMDKEATLNRLESDLEMSLYQYRDAQRRVELFRKGLVPKGEESIQALDIAYQSGDEGFLDLIDAQRVLLEFQLQAARAESDRAQALAMIEKITGVQLNLER